MVVEIDDAANGRMKQPGVQVRLRGTPGAIQGRAPTLGEHNEELLAEAGQSAVRASSANGASGVMAALEGVRVLDLCIVLAGPTCGRTLGEFGADVIKIDDPSRPYDLSGNLDVNRGKRSILLDLKKPEGRDVFWRLVKTADVVVENNRKGSLARLGLGYDEVKQRKPNIVYASLNAFGYDGPWAGRPGWEQLAQATTGIQVRRGGRDAAPQLLPYPMNDYGTGLLGAYAVALALHHRNRTGEGQSVDSGLALTAGLLQSPYFLDFQGYQRNEPEGLSVRGHNALSRLYQASDGWLYLHCPDDSAWENMARLPEFGGVSADPRFTTPAARTENDGALADALAAVFTTGDRKRWVDVLNPTGASVMENRTIPEFRHDEAVRVAGLIVGREHPGFGMADTLGLVSRLSGTPSRLGRPTPVLGADTGEILAEAGYTAGEIGALQAAGAVAAAG